MNQPAKKKGLPTWAIVLIVIAAAAPVVLGIVSALAIYGVRKYMVEAKRAEAVSVLGQWSKGMVACGEKDGLPVTSPAVPASLSAVAAKKYQSTASEWSDPAFACARFSLTEPQYFQYQWQQLSASEGNLVARADFDGDGTAEEHAEVHVTCQIGRCTASPAAKP